MKKLLFFLGVAAIISSLLTGCGTTSQTSSGSGGGQNTPTVPVSLTMTDDPPNGVSVLFFQVSLTAASLTPATGSPVSLISTPIQVDVTQLQALSAFLSTANVPAGSYTGLNLTFASPQLLIQNNSDLSIASTCAIGSTCLLTPTVDDSAEVSLTASPFPVTISANSPLGFLIDFHLNTIIQPDLSVDLNATDGVTLSQLPSSSPSQPSRYGSVTGTIVSNNVSQNQFTMQTAWGRTYTVDTNSDTQLLDWPPCVSPGGLACLAAGDIVQVQVASVEKDGDLLAASVKWLLSSGQQTATGTIVGFTSCPSTDTNVQECIELILHNNPTNNQQLPLGGEATVAIADGATFSIDASGFTLPAGAIFTGLSTLAIGQSVQLNVVAGTLTEANSTTLSQSGWSPPSRISFTTNNIQLEPSQISGTVSDIDAPNFTLNTFQNYFHQGASSGISVQTTAQTTYQRFSTDNFSGLEDDDLVSVNGWLIETDNGQLDPAITPPYVVAETITLHSDRHF
jgi:hypothetical protein